MTGPSALAGILRGMANAPKDQVIRVGTATEKGSASGGVKRHG